MFETASGDKLPGWASMATKVPRRRHKESISIAVLNSVGKVVMECVTETKASVILQFLNGLSGDLHVTERVALGEVPRSGTISARFNSRSEIVASLFSHAVATLGISACFYQPRIPKRVWVLGTVCSLVPDLDVLGFRFGIHYADFWGHRGFTHSLVFAACLAGVLVAAAFRRGVTEMSPLLMWSYFFLVTASHGFLDAMTDGGLGVAFFAPFDNRRFFLPWTPIRVSPIGISRFFTSRGLAVLQSEILWIWLPTAMLSVGAFLLRRPSQPSPD